MKLGQSTEYNVIFLAKSHAGKEARKLVPELFLFSKSK